MKLSLYQVDAFTEKIFGGNPAAIVPLKEWLPKEVMQNIAAENNLSETAFFVPNQNDFELRWFTPAVEVDLCGHATLASAHVLFNHLNYDQPEIRFQTRSGLLRVKRNSEWLSMNFPADYAVKIEIAPLMQAALQTQPMEVYNGRLDYLAVLPSSSDVLQLNPDFSAMKELGQRGVIVTSREDDVDFVSRYFAPNAGINEDPVTGSAHCVLIPYWSMRLNKDELIARQVSNRGGYLKCKLLGDRVEMSGRAATFLTGEIVIDQ